MVSAEAEIFQRLGRWLGIMDAWYEQMPVLMDLCLLRDALATHLLPLAAWALRPHLRPLLGRVMPPPDPPDAVLKDEEVQNQLRSYWLRHCEASAGPTSPNASMAPEAPEAPGYPPEPPEPVEVAKAAPVAPILMGRLREPDHQTMDDQKPPLVEVDPEVDRTEVDRASDSGTLDYSTDEEEDGSAAEIGFQRILAPVLT